MGAHRDVADPSKDAGGATIAPRRKGTRLAPASAPSAVVGGEGMIVRRVAFAVAALVAGHLVASHPALADDNTGAKAWLSWSATSVVSDLPSPSPLQNLF